MVLDEVRTDDKGYATLTTAFPVKPQEYGLAVSFDGDRYRLPTETESVLTVEKETVVLEVSAPKTAEIGQAVPINVTVVDDENNPIGDLSVLLFQDGQLVREGLTDARGRLTLTWTPRETYFFRTATQVVELRVEGGELYEDGFKRIGFAVVRPLWQIIAPSIIAICAMMGLLVCIGRRAR